MTIYIYFIILFLLKLFRKKSSIFVDVIDINAMHVSTGQIGGYIKKLYKEEEFSHMGYRFENRNGLSRFVIYTLPYSKEIIQYFKDRCPAMIEEECKVANNTPHKFIRWDNGFEEISMTD